MSSCTHTHHRTTSWLPSALVHDEHNHNCGCFKCYLSDIVSASKIEFVWMIEYIPLFLVFKSESKKLKTYFLCSSLTTRSPPLYK